MLVSCIIATGEEKRKTRIRTYVKALAKDSAVRCMANFVFFIASFAHAIRLVLHMLFFESIPRTRQWKKQRNSFDKTLPGGAPEDRGPGTFMLNDFNVVFLLKVHL